MRPVLVVAGGGRVTGGRGLQGRRGSGVRAPAPLLRARGRGGRQWLEGEVGRRRKSREVAVDLGDGMESSGWWIGSGRNEGILRKKGREWTGVAAARRIPRN